MKFSEFRTKIDLVQDILDKMDEDTDFEVEIAMELNGEGITGRTSPSDVVEFQFDVLSNPFKLLIKAETV